MSYDNLVFIGRFRPFTSAHLHVVQKALSLSNKLIIVVGSCLSPRSFRNPWLFEEVEAMIRATLSPDDNARVVIRACSDHPYADHEWVRCVQGIVDDVAVEGETVGLIGHSKDDTSYYLKMFPMWGSVDVENHRNINATDVRRSYFLDRQVDDRVPDSVRAFLQAWQTSDAFAEMLAEYDFITGYTKEWGAGPFLTADSVVVQAGHILMIQRGGRPQVGSWALPGGFMGRNETLLDAAVRELVEETEIDMPRGAIYGSFKAAHLFDHPNRDPRARIITQAHLFDLNHELDRKAKRRKGAAPLTLTRIRGADDAAHAEWLPLDKLNPAAIFADHYAIIQKMLTFL